MKKSKTTRSFIKLCAIKLIQLLIHFYRFQTRFSHYRWTEPLHRPNLHPNYSWEWNMESGFRCECKWMMTASGNAGIDLANAVHHVHANDRVFLFGDKQNENRFARTGDQTTDQWKQSSVSVKYMYMVRPQLAIHKLVNKIKLHCISTHLWQLDGWW